MKCKKLINHSLRHVDCSGRDILHGWEMKEGHIKLFIGNSEGKCPLGRLKIRWEDNITLDLKEVDYEGDWKALA